MSENTLNLDELISGVSATDKPVAPADTNGATLNLEANTAVDISVGSETTTPKEETVSMENTTATAAETTAKGATAPATPKAVKAAKPAPVKVEGLTDVYSYLTTHQDKIVNANLIKMAFTTVPAGKYLLYLGTEAADATIFKIDFPNTLQLQHAEVPTAITIYNSGIVVDCPTQRSYILRTNCRQFTLDKDGVPTEMRMVSKTASKDPVKTTAAGAKYSEVEALKLLIKKEAVTLYAKVKDLQTIQAIVDEVIAFRPTKTDVLYQVKMDEILLDVVRA